MIIRLNEMVFYGFHGVHPEERKLGQRFIVTLSVETDPDHDQAVKHLHDTVNYEKLFEVVKHNLENKQFELLEHCANSILDHVMQDFPLVQTVEVSIRKPGVAIAGVMESVEVELVRSR
jgi:7,8-dihydroneopterin aldolase/epimerase/oxygenase